MENYKIWLIGASNMAFEYAKVLNGLGVKFLTIGRGEENAKKMEEHTKYPVIRNGLENFLKTKPAFPEHVIVALNIDALQEQTRQLIEYGVKNILVEKPGALTLTEIQELNIIAKKFNSNVFIAYNRRFYSSVLHAEKIIKEDGGITSCNFEFTEWIDQITPLPFFEEIKKYWLIGNSSHVIDLAFHFAGFPKEISTFTSKKISWHPSSAIFSGAGITEKGSLFSYKANWLAPGRWGVELLTPKHRFIFCPMESLKIQNINSVKIEDVTIDNELDTKYKSGFFLQTKAFLENETNKLKTLKEQEKSFELYYKIAGYKQ